jgi:hypothetical protein
MLAVGLAQSLFYDCARGLIFLRDEELQNEILLLILKLNDVLP